VNVALAKRGYDEFTRFSEITGGTADFHRRRYLETVAEKSQEDEQWLTPDFPSYWSRMMT
jgi:hypothetical protein